MYFIKNWNTHLSDIFESYINWNDKNNYLQLDDRGKTMKMREMPLESNVA